MTVQLDRPATSAGVAPGDRSAAYCPRALIIIPAFNEAGVIGRVIEGIKSVGLRIDREILVVDDGSTDATAAEARAAGARTVSLIENLGYGYALQTGYRIALEEGFDIIVQLDGDGQHDPGSIPGMIEPLLNQECDLAIGSRARSAVAYPMPLARRIGQRVFSTILRRMCGLRIQDPTSGFQAIAPAALRLYSHEDFPGDYPDADNLLYLHLNGVRIREVPAVFRVNTRGKSMHSGVLRPAFYIYKMLFSMLLVQLRHRDAEKGGRG